MNIVGVYDNFPEHSTIIQAKNKHFFNLKYLCGAKSNNFETSEYVFKYLVFTGN